jgi:hypothetical protein
MAMVPEGAVVSRMMVSETWVMLPARSRIWKRTSRTPSPGEIVSCLAAAKASQADQVVPPSSEKRI